MADSVMVPASRLFGKCVPVALVQLEHQQSARMTQNRHRQTAIHLELYQLTGSESYSFDDIAATLSDLSGKAVNYTPAEKLAFEAQMKERSASERKVRG